jgi:hypothetical protein
MDNFDRSRYAAVYRLLAEVLERERLADSEEKHVSFIMGDLARRVFVGTQFVPPDEMLESVAKTLRAGDADELKNAARHLREHAEHLESLTAQPGAE